MNIQARPGWAAAAGAGLLYLSTPSSFFNFDGVACAVAVDLGQTRYLTHGNHLSYGLLGLAWHSLWRLLGYAGPAIYPLQVLNSLLGGLSVGLFCSALLRLGFATRMALAASAAFAVSYAQWFWSLEAQVYPLGLFFVLLSLREAAAERPRARILGLWQAGAVLGHVGHAMLAPAAALLLWTKTPAPGRRAALARWLATAAGVTAAAYAAAAVFCVRPRSLEEVRVWLLGSAALSPDRSFLWHGLDLPSALRSWASMCLRVFSDPAPGMGGLPAARLLGASALGAALWGLRRAPALWARAAALWLGCYAILYVSWEPFTIVYRLSDLPALWLLAAFALRGLPRAGWAILAAWTATAGTLNGLLAVGPRADPAANVTLADARWISAHTPPEAWVAAESLGQVYWPYFAHRRPLSLRYFAGPESLRARAASLEGQGEPVFVLSRTLRNPDVSALFKGARLEEAAREGERVLYRMR